MMTNEEQCAIDLIDRIFAESADFDLCSALEVVMEMKYGHRSIVSWTQEIPEERKIIYYIEVIIGLIRCEGFERFWAENIRHECFAIALDKIGSRHEAEMIRKSLKIIAPKSLLGDPQALIDRFGSWEAVEHLAEGYETFMYDRMEGIRKKLAVYARRRRYSFVDLAESLSKQVSFSENLKRRE